MPENNRPAAKPVPPTEPGDLALEADPTENPRLKRRSLKVRPGVPIKPIGNVPPSSRELAREAPPRSASEASPDYVPRPLDDDDVKNAAVKFTEAKPARPQPTAPATKAAHPWTSSVTRPTPASAQTTPPEGTRPTLYYSTGQRKDKTTPSPMKSTPPASMAASHSHPHPPRASASATIHSLRPVNVVDYRTNAERQSREQHTIGNLLSIVVYVLIGFFVLGAGLAGYGLYALSKQIQRQSMTIGELDQRYSAETQALSDQLKSTMDTLAQAQAQIGREQELILRQQEAINKLMTASDAAALSLRQERLIRADEMSDLRSRVNALEGEGSGRTTQRY